MWPLFEETILIRRLYHSLERLVIEVKKPSSLNIKFFSFLVALKSFILRISIFIVLQTRNVNPHPYV